ncbi:KdsC family phosphatase [Acetomicrobium sp. UBA5826]|uniref:KdsC family phosphatase n=1 Tax=Acetomicrobium sp. UBA5826 TaxID=1946039 RepID=UPI00257D9E4B|nr:HAD-IIIA family hydrolase [Acetomicrobium sp. UBA5826]
MMKIKLLAMDVDGTLTDGSVYMDGEGHEFKRFDIQDGMGIALLRREGIEIALISGRFSASTDQRAKGLGISLVFNGVRDKLGTLKSLTEKLGLRDEEVAYIGDDVNDIDCIKWAGLGIAVANARPEVLEAAGYITRSSGGMGAVREVADLLLKEGV